MRDFFLNGNYQGIKLPSFEIEALSDLEKKIGSTIPYVEEIKWEEEYQLGCSYSKDTNGFVVRDNHIIELGIRNCRLKSIPDTIKKLKFVEVIELSCNILIELPYSIGELGNLRKLNLNRNNLKKLPDSFGKLKSLQYLNLGENKLEKLPDSFENLSLLKELKLFSNKLKSLPGWFGNLRKLQKLNLYSNSLIKLPDSFGKLKSLIELRLSANNLKKLPDSFGELSSLEFFRAQQNHFSSLPNNFGQLRKLKYLNLWKNRLVSLPNNFGDLNSIENLQLGGNKLDENDLLQLRKIPRLKGIEFDKVLLKSNSVSFNDIEKTEVGSFEITSGELTVLDPHGNIDSMLNFRVPNGLWDLYIVNNKDSNEKKKIISVLSIHHKYKEMDFFPEDWIEKQIRIGSKQCGIFDLSMVPDNTESECDICLNEDDLIPNIQPHGFNKKLGFVWKIENDIYPVFCYQKENGYVVGVWVIFSWDEEKFSQFIKI